MPILETNMQQNKSKDVFNTIKTITKGIDRSPTSSSIRSSSGGELLSNPDKVKQRWFEYGKALYNHQPTIDSSCLNAPTFGPNHCSDPAILRSEIRRVYHIVAYLQVGVYHIVAYHDRNFIRKWTSGICRVRKLYRL